MLTRIALIVTTHCDLHCAHCLRGLSDEKVDFPLDLLPRLLEEARPFGAQHVGFTGGEPHLHPHFPELVEIVTRAGYSWHFVSNGMRSEPYIPLMERFKDSFTGATLSIDGANPETHDALRRKPGAFQHVVDTARCYCQAGFSVYINCNLNPQNKDQLEDFLHLVEDLGAGGINFGSTIPTLCNQHLVMSDAELSTLYTRIKNLRQATKLDVRTTSCLFTQGGVNFCGNLNLTKAAFNPRGEMLFCCDTSGYGGVVGSLKAKSYAGLIKDWLCLSADLQAERVTRIAQGQLGEGFDSCTFCNEYLANYIVVT